ncbi:MAG: AraC family transcriptional regulator [Scytonematopsis contorta HA4267-MV1]|jgi:AraC-like DNA-binding protein|nr:AraC family transcriptional regulator [Scytonematopsis contorta HA4267-MV1]
MLRVITEADWDELYYEAEQRGELVYSQTASESVNYLPSQIGNGGDCTIALRDGISINILNLELLESLRLDRYHEASSPLISKFYLTGNSRVLTPGTVDIKNEYEEICGQNYLYYLPNIREFEDWQGREKVHVLMIYVSPSYLKSFNQGFETLPQQLRLLIEENSPQRFHQSLGYSTPVMRQALQQILDCPYQGFMRKMFLESKAVELLSLQFTAWTNEKSDSIQRLHLKKDDIERLHQAKELLSANFHNPPSILELARSVGINDYKLKAGFRQVFGTTPFGYLRDLRLTTAQQLLRNTEISIEQVSRTIGYKSRSKFTVAFQKKFGINPKAFQKM